MNDHRKRTVSKVLAVRSSCLACLMVTGLVARGSMAKEATTGPAAEVRLAASGFFEALDRLDADALGRLMTEDCVSVIPGPGGVTTILRSDYLARVRVLRAAQRAPAPARAWRDLDVRVNGDAAVMTGFTGPEDSKGRLIEEAFVSTLWIHRGGRWLVTYSQRTPAGSAGEVARWNDVFHREVEVQSRAQRPPRSRRSGGKAGQGTGRGNGPGA